MFRYLLSRRRATARALLRAWIAHPRLRAGWLSTVRKMTAAGLIGTASAAWGLGLGDIELDSALNEKLNAEIELLDAQGLQPTEIIVSLASADDFERVGVERFFFLTDLRFEVAYENGAVRNVKVSSSQPVTEPYLNFLVEVLWPSGRLLKEYTLLLDPPTFSPAPAPTVSAPGQARDQGTGAGRVERESGSTASRGTQVQLAPGRAQEPSPLDEGVVDGEYRMTDRNDTLWAIASRTRPSNAVSVQQNMLAIQRLNPGAFLSGNINLLKAGYTLRLPTESEALAVSDAQASQQVAMQNEDWRALKSGEPVPERGEQRVAASDDTSSELQGQVDATPAGSSPAPQSAASGDGELRIVAGAGDIATGTGGATTEALDAAREEQDRLSREVEELNEALDRERELASNQVAVKDRQLEVKDQQIAEMQAELERMQQEMAQSEAGGAAQRQNQSASGAEPWWQSPYVLGGAAGVVVLLLVYVLVAARRTRAAAEQYYPEVSERAFAATPAEQPGRAADAVAAQAADPVEEVEDLDLLDGEEDGPQVTTAAAEDDGAAAPVAPSGASQTGDVIGEADIYIAYGRYPQAIGLLLGVLEEDPDRNDVRLKLLELYAETRDREAFDQHMAELLERCDDDEALLTARELSQQFGGADDDGAPAPGTVDLSADLAVDDDTTALSLEELHSDDTAALADGGPATPDEPAGAEDFELELDELTEARAEDDAGRAGDALGGDLGIDFDPDRDRAAPSDPADELSATHDLDLDLDDDALGDDAFDFEAEGDTASTKLDLARAYIDMGDQDGARDILNEVVTEGSTEQQQRAQEMLEEL